MKVSLFIPCLVEQFNPAVGEAAARVLARAGARVDYPPARPAAANPFTRAATEKRPVSWPAISWRSSTGLKPWSPPPVPA